MLLNKLEFMAMNNPIRRFIQRSIEIKRLRSLSSLPPGKSILEIGCGNGYGTSLISEHFKPKTIMAIDLDSRMIELAKRMHSNSGVTYAVGDASKLEFDDNKFDAVLDFGIIHHIPNWRVCLKELCRVLKPEGELIIEDGSIESFETFVGKYLRKVLAHPYQQMYKLEDFLRELEKVGFSEIKVRKYSILGGFAYFALSAKKAKV